MHFVKCNPSQDNAGTRTEWDSGLCSFAALRGMCCKLLFPHLLRPLCLSWAVPCACHFSELTSQAGSQPRCSGRCSSAHADIPSTSAIVFLPISSSFLVLPFYGCQYLPAQRGKKLFIGKAERMEGWSAFTDSSLFPFSPQKKNM